VAFAASAIALNARAIAHVKGKILP
jgi:hypothetical protein